MLSKKTDSKRILSTALFAGVLLTGTAFADSIAIQAPSRAEIQLEQSATLKGTVQVPAGFTGDIALSADTSALPQGSSEATFAVSPDTIHIATAQTTATTVPFHINVHSQAGSHSFKDASVQVTAKTGSLAVSQTVLMTVDAIYEIDLYGGNIPEGWSSPMTLAMPKHDGGVTIRFVNMDKTATHTIHGEDAIPHQDTTTPLAVATDNGPGGVYEVNVPSGDPVSGEYRCHDHETEDMLRTISFNN